MSLNLIDQAAQRKRIDDLLANPVESAKELEQLRLKLASRDAEVAELKEDATDFHGQINRLTEWNNNLVSHRDELKSELFDLTKQRDALSRIADTLEQERDQLREQVTLLRDVLSDFDKAAINSKSIIGFAGQSFKLITKMRKALAATEPK